MTDTSQTIPRPITMLAVRELIAECVGVELEEVTPTARFTDDLGGESIDVIDLAFRLEKAFHIKSPFKALNNDELWERDASGRLTPGAQELIRTKLPFLNIAQLESATGAFSPISLLTTELIYQMSLHAAAN
ncbi:MAG: acpP 2 [Planctomycetaceae bacterium]|nr:acpP 2 [Planctomycetaceae bacterium]